MHSYDTFHTRSSNDKTMTLNHVHLLSCRTVVGWEKGRLLRWLASCRPLQHREAKCYKRWSSPSPPPPPPASCGLSYKSCRCLAGVTSSHSVNTLPARHLCLVVVLSLSCSGVKTPSGLKAVGAYLDNLVPGADSSPIPTPEPFLN